MIYHVTNDFTKINETSGTVQNNSSVYDVEISDRPTAGSGILLHPLNKFTFNNQIYVRCVAGGWAAINVVPFIVDGSSVISSSGSSTTGDQSFSQADLDYIFG